MLVEYEAGLARVDRATGAEIWRVGRDDDVSGLIEVGEATVDWSTESSRRTIDVETGETLSTADAPGADFVPSARPGLPEEVVISDSGDVVFRAADRAWTSRSIAIEPQDGRV